MILPQGTQLTKAPGEHHTEAGGHIPKPRDFFPFKIDSVGVLSSNDLQMVTGDSGGEGKGRTSQGMAWFLTLVAISSMAEVS